MTVDIADNDLNLYDHCAVVMQLCLSVEESLYEVYVNKTRLTHSNKHKMRRFVKVSILQAWGINDSVDVESESAMIFNVCL